MSKLINEQTGKEILVGEVVKTFRDEEMILVGFRDPHKPSSTGRVIVKDFDGRINEFFPGVVGARIVGHEFDG